MNPSSATLTERLRMVAGEEALAQIGARVEDLADPEVRAAAIRADHPDLERALREGLDEVVIDGEPVSIRLHFAMHEILANQLADNDPPEVYATAVRLREDGYGRHEVLHMVAAPLAAQILATVTNGEGYDRERHIAALQDLPRSWEQRRGQRTLARKNPSGRHAARRRR
jgi:hypothetical protein